MRPARVRGDDGAVAVVTAVCLMTMVMAAAVVVDLGFVRVDVRVSQMAADSAVTAGAPELGDQDHEAACQAAWRYFTASIDGSPAADHPGCATHFGSAFGDCTTRATSSAAPSTSPSDPGPVVLEMSHGDHLLRLQMPVRHVDDDATVLVTDTLLGGQAHEGAFDGTDPCERLGAEVVRTRAHVLAGVAGFATGSSKVDAVARARQEPPDPSDFANLVVLDRTECEALWSDGKGRLTVQSTTTATGEVLDGYIAIDSDATGAHCDPALGNSGHHAVEVTNNDACTTPLCGISATGEIFSHGMLVGNDSTAYDGCDVDQGTGQSCNGKPILLQPVPIAGPRVTRAVVDHRYNCHATYPAYDAATAPQYPVDAVAGCGGGSPRPHVDDLVAAYGGPGVPAGFVDATSTYPQLADCSLEGGEGDLTITGVTHLHVDCAPLYVKNALVLEGVDVVVFTGGVRIEGSSAAFRTNPTTPRDHVLHVRAGSIDRASTDADVQVQQGTIYLHDATAALTLAGGGGSGAGSVSLVAPVGPQDAAACNYAAGAPPPARCFEDLAVWSNGSTEHSVAGQGGLYIEGTVFTPNAGRGGITQYFRLAGQGNQTLDHAQFISHRLLITGEGLITMRPDPDRITPTNGNVGVGLIR